MQIDLICGAPTFSPRSPLKPLKPALPRFPWRVDNNNNNKWRYRYYPQNINKDSWIRKTSYRASSRTCLSRCSRWSVFSLRIRTNPNQWAVLNFGNASVNLKQSHDWRVARRGYVLSLCLISVGNDGEQKMNKAKRTCWRWLTFYLFSFLAVPTWSWLPHRALGRITTPLGIMEEREWEVGDLV